MKFGKKLRRHLDAQWEASYINYKLLKKLVYVDSNDNAFMAQIALETTKVNAFFLVRLRDINDQARLFFSWLRDHHISGGATDMQLWDLVAEQPNVAVKEDQFTDPLARTVEFISLIDRVRAYCSLNYLGFVKILKKFEKQRKGRRIQAQALEHIRMQPFFSSTELGQLLARLDGVKLLLGGKLDTFSGCDLSIDPSFLCPVCLDVTIQPAILCCGHRFCNNCLVDYRAVKGTDCPVCRRPHVLEHATVDPNMTAFVQALWPARAKEVAELADERLHPTSDPPVAHDSDSSCDGDCSHVKMAETADEVMKPEPSPQVSVGDWKASTRCLDAFSGLLDHAVSGTLFVFDIDETLVTNHYAPCMLLSPQGVDAFQTCLANSSHRLDFSERNNVRKQYQDALHSVRLVEEDTAALVKTLQDRGHPVCCLTARAPEHAQYTRAVLLEAGLDLTRTAPRCQRPDLLHFRYEHGVMFSGPLHKGPVLAKFLEACYPSESNESVPTAIVFVDDRDYNVMSVAQALAENPRWSSVACTSYLYGRATHKYVQDKLQVDYEQHSKRVYWHNTQRVTLCVGQEILRVQLQHLFFNGVLLSDEKAISLLNSTADQDQAPTLPQH